jgi:hypothetical protein
MPATPNPNRLLYGRMRAQPVVCTAAEMLALGLPDRFGNLTGKRQHFSSHLHLMVSKRFIMPTQLG